MINRDLDAEIAESIFGWKLISVGKDANDENDCEILVNGQLSPDYRLPNVGKLHKGFLTPQYSSNLQEAIKLAVKVGMRMDISEIDFKDWQFPEKLAAKSLEFWKNHKTGI